MKIYNLFLLAPGVAGGIFLFLCLSAGVLIDGSTVTTIVNGVSSVLLTLALAGIVSSVLFIVGLIMSAKSIDLQSNRSYWILPWAMALVAFFTTAFGFINVLATIIYTIAMYSKRKHRKTNE